MDTETKIELMKQVGEEIITVGELRELFETKAHPIAYDGFEPSGFGHLPLVMRAMNVKNLLKTGIKFKVILVDWLAWLNNKMGGDLEKIRTVGKYFIEVWKAAGVDTSKIEILWTADILDKEYMEIILKVAKNTTISRVLRCSPIMGRTKGESQGMGQLVYPLMQAADIFKLKIDICQLGMGQRRVNILAREIGEKIGFWKPVAVHHHMLPSLVAPHEITKGSFDENDAINRAIAGKMSKSKPHTCIYVHDNEKTIHEKVMKAYCPEKVVEGNPMLDYTKHIIMRQVKSFSVKRPEKFGGNVEFTSYEDIERAFVKGKLHPLDLKKAVAVEINNIIKPVREHFMNNKKAAELYSIVKEQKITR